MWLVENRFTDSISSLSLSYVHRLCAPPSHKRLNIVISQCRRQLKQVFTLFFSSLLTKRAREKEDKVVDQLSLFLFLSVKQKLNGDRKKRDVELCRTWFVEKNICRTSKTSNQRTKRQDRQTIVYLNMMMMWPCGIHKYIDTKKPVVQPLFSIDKYE